MIASGKKDELLNTSLLTGDNLDDLIHDLRLLLNDYTLTKAKYRFQWAISYTELYRFLYPALELLTSVDRKNFFLRQFVLRFYAEKIGKPMVLLNEVKNEYRMHVHIYEKALRKLVPTTSDKVGRDYLRWLIKTDRYHKDRYTEFNRIVEGFVPDTDQPDEITEAVMIALKAVLLRREYSHGRSEYSRLIKDETLCELDRETELELETDEQFRSVKNSIEHDFKSKYLDRPTTLSNMAGSVAKIIQLNRTCKTDRQINVMLIETSDFVREKTMTSTLYEALEVSDYRSELFVLRSLNYCLLDMYMREILPSIDERIKEVKRIYDMLRDLQPYQSSASAAKPELRNELSKMRAKLRKMDAWFQLKAAVDERIRRSMIQPGEGDSETFLPSPEFVDRLEKLVSNPEDVFTELKVAHARLNEVLKSMSGDAHRLRQIVLPKPSVFLSDYNPQLLTSEDIKIGVGWFEERFRQLRDSDIGMNGIESIIEETASKISTNESAPALYLLLSVAQRLLGNFRAADEAISKALQLSPQNPEAEFQEALLIKFKVDAAVTSLNKEDILQRIGMAINKVKSAIDSKYARPVYYQFAANMQWRRARILTDDNLENLSKDSENSIKEAATLCKTALERFRDLRGDRIQSQLRTISLDLVYYLSLLGGKDQVEQASLIMAEFKEEELSPRQMDTLALVRRRQAEMTEEIHKDRKLELYREAVRLYCIASAKSQSDRDKGLINQYLGSTLAAYLSAGGKVIDLPSI